MSASEAFVSRAPISTGNGYDYGGDWFVTINGTTLNCGSDEFLARTIHAAPDALVALHVITEQLVLPAHLREMADAAIAKSTPSPVIGE